MLQLVLTVAAGLGDFDLAGARDAPAQAGGSVRPAPVAIEADHVRA